MGESDHNKHRKNDTGDTEKLAAEYSYLDYLIEKKFYKKYWGLLRVTLYIGGAILAGLAYFGMSEYSDLRNLLRDAEVANAKIQTVYQEHLRQDSLNMLREDYGHTYVYAPFHDVSQGFHESIERRFKYYGFGFADYKIEDSLNWYLFEAGHWEDNDAYKYITDKSKANVANTCIGIVYNGLSDAMRNRVDSVFREIYSDAEIEYYRDSLLPASGFLYFIH